MFSTKDIFFVELQEVERMFDVVATLIMFSDFSGEIHLDAWGNSGSLLFNDDSQGVSRLRFLKTINPDMFEDLNEVMRLLKKAEA